jgi:hypothetical protein
MNWLVVESQRGELHVVPDDARLRHFYNSQCWCNPEKQRTDDGEEMYVHHEKERLNA